MKRPNFFEASMSLFAFMTCLTLIVAPQMFGTRNSLDIYISYEKLFGSEHNLLIASLITLALYLTLLFVDWHIYRFVVNLYGFVYISCNAVTYLVNYPTLGLAFALPLVIGTVINLFKIITISEEQRKIKEKKKVIKQFEDIKDAC